MKKIKEFWEFELRPNLGHYIIVFGEIVLFFYCIYYLFNKLWNYLF